MSEDSPVEKVVLPAKKFRFQNASALLTYKTHIKKDTFIKWFEEKVKQVPKFIRLCHETGANKGTEEQYDHTHVVFVLVNRFSTTNQRFFDYEDLHPNIKCLNTKKAIEDAKYYISKEDPENEDLKQSFNYVTNIWSESSLLEALKKHCERPSDALGIIALYKAKQNSINISDDEIPNQKWQLDLIERVKDSPNQSNKRKVIWVCDKKGGAGKTDFARYHLGAFPEKWFMSKDMGTSRDAATIITNALDNGWLGHGMILDLPRSAENHSRIYTFIEEIKDGVVTAQKYSGGTRVFPKPHLIVFANWLPQFFRLSLDRWECYLVETDKKTDDKILVKYKITKKDLKNPESNESIEFDD